MEETKTAEYILTFSMSGEEYRLNFGKSAKTAKMVREQLFTQDVLSVKLQLTKEI